MKITAWKSTDIWGNFIEWKAEVKVSKGFMSSKIGFGSGQTRQEAVNNAKRDLND